MFQPRSELSHVAQRLKMMESSKNSLPKSTNDELTQGANNGLQSGTVTVSSNQSVTTTSTGPEAETPDVSKKTTNLLDDPMDIPNGIMKSFEQLSLVPNSPLKTATANSLTHEPTLIPLSNTVAVGAMTEVSTTENGQHTSDVIDKNVDDEPEDIGQGPFDVWMSIIVVEIKDAPSKVRHMALISWKQLPPIPDFELYKKGVPFKTGFRTMPTTFRIDRLTLDKLAQFTLSISSAITNKEFECPLIDFPYFFAPLKTYNTDVIEYPTIMNDVIPMDTIDWDEIDQIIAKEQPTVDLDHLEQHVHDKILIDYADNSRRYLIEEIRRDLHPNSPPPQDLKIRESEYENFAAYYLDNFKIEVTRMDQPMVRVQRIQKVMNFLMPVAAAAPQEKKRTATFVIPEFCKVFWASASVYQSAMVLPSIMTRLDSYLLVKEASLHYDLPITDDLMLESYTTPSASMAMNYERLETLGGK